MMSAAPSCGMPVARNHVVRLQRASDLCRLQRASDCVVDRWFSGNIADWIWGSGQVGDALNYGMFMIGGIIAYGSILAIRWGYFGRG